MRISGGDREVVVEASRWYAFSVLWETRRALAHSLVVGTHRDPTSYVTDLTAINEIASAAGTSEFRDIFDVFRTARAFGDTVRITPVV